MREIEVAVVTQNIKEMCIEANHFLSRDMIDCLHSAKETETNSLGRQVLEQLNQNLEIAGKEMIPICQDTGMAVVFVELGQEVRVVGGSLNEAINEGVRQGYREGYLRNSVVNDPLKRINTNDNTPAVIHYEITCSDKITMTLAPKGFGSENMSRLFMLKPSDGYKGVIDAVITAVREAGANACPPLVIGVGIGGTFEKCAYLSKKALTRPVNEMSAISHISQLEEELLAEINKLGIGAGGLGGKYTALKVNIETYPTHIAGLPVAVNIGCHVNRHVTRTL
ncbi:MAG: fumarate hydratase [Lachnospiraceae bacterium]|nr:fumarate hydratase [Lachnospiraceae bacterium]